ncbi:DUF4328 domain-containing protein [Nocardia wallacei]|uniref:DUF4328 domain-containing protein n=1 Tax=Nocardia wallacei TaxID=480035 RepID=UPI002453EEF2|nr:DUF4328 domain-containing protein [Nocardia wallacei]
MRPVSTVVQPCARCGARWAVQGRPNHWCPRCRGVLLSPAPVDAPAERRNYRWVARPPGRQPRDGRPARPARPTPATPRYRETPRWGLRDEPPRPAPAAGGRLAAFVERRDRLLITTAVVFGLAAMAEFVRYLILLHNRTRLIHPAALLLSDLAVYVTACLALLFALAAAIGLIGSLVHARRSAYAEVGRRDPRSPRILWGGSLIPVVNLVFPGVFLTELARLRGDDPRLPRAVRIWWCVWVLNGLLVAGALLWRTADSMQGQADGVAFTAWTDLAAAAVAVLSLWLVRLLEGCDLRGRVRLPKRWVASVGPVVPVIEPVHPAAESAERAPDPVVGDNEHEEVMAK